MRLFQCSTAVLTAVLLPVYVVAHMTSVCTSTAPSQCNSKQIVFWFGSYHANSPGGSCVLLGDSNSTCHTNTCACIRAVTCTHICARSTRGLPRRVPGEVHIEDPDGNVITTSFSNICVANARVDGSCPDADLHTNCHSTGLLPEDASITCYAAEYAAKGALEAPQSTYAVSEMCDAFPSQNPGNSFAKTLSSFYAVVPNAKSGTYVVHATGTDQNLNYCGGNMQTTHPCGMRLQRKCEHTPGTPAQDWP